MRIASLLDYSDNCHRLLQETLEQHPALLHETFVTTSRYDSIARLLAHSIAAEERWITFRILQKPLPVMYEERAATTVEGLFADAKAIRATTRQFIEPLTEEDWARPISVTLAQWSQEMTLTVEEILFHIIHHENYHRGQIVTALQRHGVDPPNFDYIFLRQERTPGENNP